MNKKPNSIFERLKLIKECPLCAHHYEESRAVVLEEYKGNHLVHITCKQCKGAILHLVMMTQLGLNSIGIITDLSAMEVANLKMKPIIDEDQLLDFHKYIVQQGNGFTKLILKHT